ASLDNLYFITKGSEIKKKAWMDIYPFRLKEKEVPDLEGDVKIIDLKTEEKETQPPKRYTPASMVAALEKKNLGTKATRASIIETLYKRGYIKGKSIEATSVGMSLITTLEKYSPIIIDEKLTKEFEEEMNHIQKSKKDLDTKEKKVIEEAKDTITKIAKQFEKNDKKIGRDLLVANMQLLAEQKKENLLNICPVCKKGNLGITYSKKTRRYFVACDAYPKCKTTFSLPPNGSIKKTGRVCEKCGFPKLMLLKSRRKPWEFCFNPGCETNK
ncbi:unnamed protein product, partial [marine sediment metagenome]